MELGLRNDVYRRPLATALDRLGLREGWRCVDVGAGGGDVSVALAEVVGRDGRVYAVDSDPHARDPDVGAVLPALARDAGLETVDTWAEAPAGAGPGPVRDYLASLTGVDPGNDPIVLPPLVTVVARRPQ